MSSLLQMLGNVVTTANAGPEALQRVAESPPDVALLDIGMPIMNGYEVAERIRKYPGGRDILLVAMTGWGQEADRSRSRAAGFDHHLVKPVEVEQLLKLLERRMTDADCSDGRERPDRQMQGDRMIDLSTNRWSDPGEHSTPNERRVAPLMRCPDDGLDRPALPVLPAPHLAPRATLYGDDHERRAHPWRRAASPRLRSG